MKKLLSVVLALVMVLSAAVSLIPTAWAESDGTLSGGDGSGAVAAPSTRPEGSWVYYEEDFESAEYAGLTDEALRDAIGFDGALDTPNKRFKARTMLLESGALRFVSEYNGTRGYTDASFNLNFAYDSRMATSVTVMEYDLKFSRRAEGAADVVVGEKTVAATGQTAQTYAYFSMGDANNTLAIGQFDTTGAVTTTGFTTTHTNYAGVAWDSKDTDAFATVDAVPAGATQSGMEYGEGDATGFDIAYHVKAVIDPVSGMFYYSVNDKVIATLSDKENYGGALAAKIANIASALKLTIRTGADVLLDNIQIYGYEPEAPSIAVTEVSAIGDYQWVELYNATQAQIDVYDYALYVNDAPEADATFADHLGYLTAGADANAGVLQPGDAAIVLLSDGAEADFRAAAGIPEATKVFTLQSALALATEGASVVGLMEIDATTGEGKYKAQSDSLRMYLESYVIMTTEASDAKTGYEGIALHEGIIPCGVNFGDADKTVELAYWGDNAARMGKVMYDADDERETTLTGDKGTKTPGFVPTACRFDVVVTVYDYEGNPQEVKGKFMTEWSRSSDFNRPYYTFIGYSVNGSEDLVQTVFMSGDGLEIRPIYQRYAPEIIGYQVSERAADGTYSVRILGAVTHDNIWTVGFNYSYSYVNENGKTINYSPDGSYECDYVYDSITVDGEVKTAAEMGYKYFFALHIENIPTKQVLVERLNEETGKNQIVPVYPVTDLKITCSSFFTTAKGGLGMSTSERTVLDIEAPIPTPTPAPAPAPVE